MSQSQLIIGLHAVRTALKHGDAVTGVRVEARRRDGRIKEILGLARQGGVGVVQVERAELDALSRGENHQGVVAFTQAPAVRDEGYLKRLLEDLDSAPFLLVLDGVQDPHNLGACLRTADAAGIDAVITPRDRSVGLTPVACKVASGAAETVPFVQVTNLVRTLKWLQEQGVWLVGTAGEAEAGLYQADLKGPLAIVMGGEGKGMRRLTREQCDALVHLPMLGAVESLNVSVATGVCLFEALRQRISE
ncbi:MAG: 23S rRNA methyltransferase [Gammaproteobacteria bacterium (ex Lamellibrachia satsuma)]|nr:MAG: 23S rRNA (guanosine(2251)-2'-O)-methyltransferase RlmB [Gammaproteobacteria bacterium (ex Lamellibrachia satsuma)]RRS32250.1 MAG: 23S rRNA methyltransferase [Gammaproteobacteria bacterium (ex Lamellibrachia satsuma)]RRS33256.1 MAG: 23S rRNA methyltransferase [Gammaproteobacteria bacterium (ex Lamellibrachia satsuma)]